MKSLKIFATAIIFTSALTASAQAEADNTEDKSVSFGVKGGVNFSSMTGEDIDNPDSRTSFHVGALVEIPVSDMFSVQAEAMYSGKGFDFEYEGTDGDNAELQLDYIDVPVLAKIYVTKGLSIEAGPQISFLINEELDSNPNSDSGDVDLDSAESVDFGLAGGLSFQTDMGIFATGRYSYGLSEIYKDVDVHNTNFQIGIGYKF
jgi:opacity protein-like surface antigen